MLNPESDYYRWWILLGLWLVYMSFGVIVASMAPLVAPIEDSLNISHASMGSIMGAWQLVYIFSAIPCGLLLDRLGGRWSILIGCLLIAGSALGRGLATDYTSLLLAVMLFGLGGPIISSGCPKVVTQFFTGSSRGVAMGIYMTGPAVGAIISLTLTHAWVLPLFEGNWRSVMFVWSGVASVGCLLWFVLSARLEPVSDTGIMLNKTDQKESQLQVIRSLLGTPAVLLVMFMSIGVFAMNHGLINWLPEILVAQGLQAKQAGYWAALPTLIGILGSLLIPRLATPERRFWILGVLCAIAMLACLLLSIADPASRTLGLILQGIARSSMMTVLVLTLVELPSIGDKRAGTASGLFFSAAEVGGMLGPLSLGVVYDISGQFNPALWSLACVCLMLVLGTVLLKKLVTSEIVSSRLVN